MQIGGSGRRGLLMAASLAGLAACKGGREYSDAVDSGAVAPAARLDTSATRSYPDSNVSGPGRMKSGMAGDTLSMRGRPAGTGVVRPADTTRRRP